MRSSRSKRGVLTPLSLKEVYPQMGEYTVKMMLDKRQSAAISEVDVLVRNADGLPMKYSFRRWGTKLTLSFTIDESTPDGVAIIDVAMKTADPFEPIHERFDFWIIK